GLGELHEPFRRGLRFRRLPRKRLWPRRRARRLAGIPRTGMVQAGAAGSRDAACDRTPAGSGGRFFCAADRPYGEALHWRQAIAGRLSAVVGKKQAEAEVSRGIERTFSYAAWTDKFDGAVHNPPFRNVALAMKEPIGTVGILCPADTPLLGFLSLVMPAICTG